jgi:hypothetical protein
MKKVLLALVLALFGGTATAEDLVYEGTWVTTNRQLDGRMTCVATDLGSNKWKGRFYGVWQGRKFDYTVEWTGTPDKLTGKATIDGAKYDWKGEMGAQSPGWFKGSFTGNRYIGSFDLKEKKK